MLKVAIGYPWSSPFMFTQCVDSVLNLRRPEGCELRFFRGRGWCPARTHTHICEQALAWDAVVIIIIGSDQTYDEDLLERLIARYREGYTFVGCLVPTRGALPDNKIMRPFQPLAWKKSAKGLELVRRDGTIQKADMIGTGVTMFEAAKLKKLRRPWFAENVQGITWNRVPNQDSTFISRLGEETDTQLWIDTSIVVKHLHIFEIDESFQERFADWAESGKGPRDICPVDDGVKLGDGASILQETFDDIRRRLPPGSGLLEFGSGAGTAFLMGFYDVTSVEDDPGWLNKHGSKYIHAPLVDGWYDPEVLKDALPPKQNYDLVLVDGPRAGTGGNRMGLLDHLGLINTDAAFVIDDLNRPKDMELAQLLARELDRPLAISSARHPLDSSLTVQWGIIPQAVKT